MRRFMNSISRHKKSCGKILCQSIFMWIMMTALLFWILNADLSSAPVFIYNQFWKKLLGGWVYIQGVYHFQLYQYDGYESESCSGASDRRDGCFGRANAGFEYAWLFLDTNYDMKKTETGYEVTVLTSVYERFREDMEITGMQNDGLVIFIEIPDCGSILEI